MSCDLLTPGILASTVAMNTMGRLPFHHRSRALFSSSVKRMTKRQPALPLDAA